MATKHNPLPWRKDASNAHGIEDANNDLVMCAIVAAKGPVIRANRDFVVRAVNNYQVLLEALEDSLQAWDGEEESVREEHADLIEQIRAALAKAQGES